MLRLETCESHEDGVVVYDRMKSTCPLCDAEEELRQVEGKVEEAENQIEILSDRLLTSQDEVEALTNKVSRLENELFEATKA